MKVSSNGASAVSVGDQRQQRAAAAPDRSCSAPASSAGRTRASLPAIARTSSRRAGLGIDQQHRQIGVRRAGPGGRHHRAVQLAPRAEDAGRVHQQHLRSRRASGCPARGTASSAPWARRSTAWRRSAGSAASTCRHSARRRSRRSRSAAVMPRTMQPRSRASAASCSAARLLPAVPVPRLSPTRHRDDEDRRVRRARARGDRVARQPQAPRFCAHSCSAVLASFGGAACAVIASCQARRTKSRAGFQPAVQIQRAQRRLQRVGQHRGTLSHAGLASPGRNRQRCGQADRPRRPSASTGCETR